MVDENAELGPDEAGAAMTGNVLCFAAESAAVTAVSDPVARETRSIDAYCFMALYPRLTDRVVVTERDPQNALDLVLWRSRGYASYQQIMGIDDEVKRQAVIRDLVQRHEFTYAWDAGGELGASFYAMDASGTISAVPMSDPVIEEDAETSRQGTLVYANVQLARTETDSSLRRAKFATADPDNWKPHGFEVKVVGPSRSRRVWMHIVVEAQVGAGETAAHPFSVIASVRDL